MGNTQIHVRYMGPDDIRPTTASMDVAVWEEEYEIIVNTTRNFDISNGSSSRLNLNPRCKHKGVLLEGAVFTYSKNAAASNCININSIVVDTLNGGTNGCLRLASNLNPLTDIPAGDVCVNVKYNISSTDSISKTVTVHIINDDYDNSDLDMYEGAAIRIDYEDDKTHNHTLPQCFDCLINVNACLDPLTTHPYPESDTNFNFVNGIPIGDDDCDMFDLIRRSKVAIITSHGAPGSFVINAEQTNIQITTNDILKLPQGYFSECELVICIFCSAGSDNYEHDDSNSISSMNIVEAFVEKGAKRAVGFIYNVLQSTAADFTEKFTTYLGGCSTVAGEEGVFFSYYEACEKALEFSSGGTVQPQTFISNTLDGSEMTSVYFWNTQRCVLLAGRSDLDAKLFDQ